MPSDEQSRRKFLRGTALTALGAGVAGCQSDDVEETTRPPTETSEPTDTATPTSAPSATPTSTATATPVPEIVERYGDRFGSIVDLADEGADLDGAEPIDDLVTDAIADDTLLYFPTGRYSMGSLDLEGYSNFGFVSLPEDDTVITPAIPGKEMDHLVRFRDASDLLLEGLDLDYTERGYGAVIRLLAHGDFVARDLRIHGKLPDWNRENKHVGFRFDVRDESSEGLVERVIARDGGHEGGNGVGIFVGKEHAGTLTFRDCEIANFPNNGLYASSPGRDTVGYRGSNGVVHVRGGEFVNNNIANVRIGSTGSTVKNVTVRVDKVPPSPTERTLNVRGIRLRARGNQLVENCTIEIGENAGMGFGAISYHPEHGSSTIRDTEISVDCDGFDAIDATDSSNGGTEEPLLFDNVTITGKATGGAAADIADRHGTKFRNCRIEQSGSDREGIVFTDSEDCLVADSTIRVTGQAIRTHNASVDRVNLTIENPFDAEDARSPAPPDRYDPPD
ncbi:twin-arginine translocation signal domain-containing protein [Halosimplex salinum]|uniref:twin-arginine translocation signal domain-containing protein n=1 Tax=Halosimplex salinum TaxID=1710538 RepID=UPI000F470FE4|nr:twin-arginine translocation signal domain-containing protein [Halosimplex salinum]